MHDLQVTYLSAVCGEKTILYTNFKKKKKATFFSKCKQYIKYRFIR